MKEELLQGLTKEQIEKVRHCKNQKEVLAMAKEEGVELTEEQLDAVAGGGCFDSPAKCPECGWTGTVHGYRRDNTYGYSCSRCGCPLDD